MNTNKILIGTLIGFIVSFILGFLFYGVLLTDFFASNTGSATGVSRPEQDMLWIPLILGHVTFGALLAIILGRWANISTLSSGAIAGGVIGLLISATHGLIMFATTNILNFTGVLGDIVVSTIMAAIAAAAISWYYGSGKKG